MAYKKQAIILLSYVTLLFTSCSKSQSGKKVFSVTNSNAAAERRSAAKKELTYEIKLGFSTNIEDPRGQASLLFKKELEERTEGRIQIFIYPDGKLGSDSELIEGVMNGTVDMTVSSAGNFAVYATKLGISAMPFLFSDFDSAWRFMDSALIHSVNDTLLEYNTVVLSQFDNGFRCVTTTYRPVRNINDMKGLNIRTPPNQIIMETMSVLGANPKPYAFNELKEALRNGLFDSQENPIPIIYNSALYEEQKYLSITNHSYDAMPFVIRKDLWDQFSIEDRSRMIIAARIAQNEDRRIVREQTETYVSKLKEKGMVVITPDLKPFIQATSGVIDTFSAVYGQELVEEFKEFIENK